ncbi:hypothetical protein P5P81_14975 [Tritonibacter mobilis]|nr:hypothetical protein [Tritonibacter mobilis]
MLSRNSKPICNIALAAGLALLTATETAALSCLPMGPGDVYRIVSEREDAFVVIEGRVSFDEALLPQYSEADPSATEEPIEIPAQVTGLLLGQRMFDQPVEGEIILEAHCLGPWCGSLVSGTRYLFFARQIEGRVVAVVEPCGGFFFSAEDGRAGDTVLQCHQGGACPSQLPDNFDGALIPSDKE